MKRKIIVVISARASYSRIRTALIAMNRHAAISLSVVLMASAAGTVYGDVETQAVSDGLRVCAVLDTLSDRDDLCGQVLTTSNCMTALAKVFGKECPDAVVTVADRYETISTAIAATYLNIPLIHLQGGEITGNIDERVRHAITKLADIHLPCTKLAAERIVRMGEDPGRVFCLGCPSCDIAQEALNDPRSAGEVLAAHHVEIDFSPEKNSYIAVMQHSVTDEYGAVPNQLEVTLKAALRIGLPILWFGNNVDAGSKQLRSILEDRIGGKRNIRFVNHLPGKDFLVVLRDCRCLIGNSSVGIRECSYMGVPVVNIGTRQGGRERGMNVVDTEFDTEKIIAAYEAAVARNAAGSDLYGDGKAGERIADLLANVDLCPKKG